MILVGGAEIGLPRPLLRVAHDGEVVVALAHQVVGARLRGIDGLRQRDAGRHTVKFHLLHRKSFVFIYVVIDFVFHRILCRHDGHQA